MSSIEGVRMGLPSHPTTRVVTKPQPFQRPSTTVTAPTVKRAWRTVPAERIDIGDTVPGIGVITRHSYHLNTNTVTVYGGDDNSAAWPATEPVYAFTAATA